MKKALLFIFLPLVTFAQTQMGQTINPDNSETIGHSVALSQNGETVVIGDPDFNDTGEGRVQIFEFNTNEWIQVGQDIVGDNSVPSFALGSQVEISNDGSIVAISTPGYFNGDGFDGKITLYKNINDVWSEIGNSIYGMNNERLGSSLSLSADGNIVAVGGYHGIILDRVVIYQNINDQWELMGSPLMAEESNSGFGRSVSLSSDGMTLAVGEDRASNKGAVSVYQFSNDEWTQIGENILGESNEDYFGSDVDISQNGTTVAIAATGKDDDFTNAGQVRVYSLSNNQWSQVGQNINGLRPNEGDDIQVRLSNNAQTLIASWPYYGNELEKEGIVKIFKNENEQWVEVGQSITGNDFFTYAGSGLNISSDGSVLAVGSPKYYLARGFVQMFDLSDVLSVDTNDLLNISVYPVPSSSIVNITTSKSNIIKSINIYNIQGQIIDTLRTPTINISNLESGLYILEIITNKGKSNKRIVKI